MKPDPKIKHGTMKHPRDMTDAELDNDRSTSDTAAAEHRRRKIAKAAKANSDAQNAGTVVEGGKDTNEAKGKRV